MNSKELYLNSVKVLQNIEYADVIVNVLIKNIYHKHYALDFEINETEEFTKKLERVKKGEPIQYVISEWEFMSLPFYVDRNVLIPRCDTEILVEGAIKIINQNNFETVLDLCTGSGCIGISIAKYCTETNCTCVDISKKALEITEKNSKINKVDDRVTTKMLNVLSKKLQISSKFDIITANPPYIKESEIEALDDIVKNYEPHIALTPGEDELLFYKKITENFKDNLHIGGYIFFECGINMSNDVAKILEDNGFGNITILKDLSKIDRTVFARRDY